VRHYLVEVGGELRGAGMKPDGQPWWVTLEGVPGRTAAPTVAALHGLAVATSGDYRRYFQHGARRASHTLDPRSGYPIATTSPRHRAAPAAWRPMRCRPPSPCSGPDAGLAFAEQRGLAARLLLRRAGGLEERTTDAWQAMLQ
jgi:thiamine biosynthesis lipoprotein